MGPDSDPESTKSQDPDPDPDSKFNESGSTTLLQSQGVSKMNLTFMLGYLN
jgi:hypothetical protein